MLEDKLRKLAKEGKVAELLNLIRRDVKRLGGCKDTFTLIDCCENIAKDQPGFADWCVGVALWMRDIVKQKRKELSNARNV